MDVNTSVKGVGVFRLQTTQPDNARYHRITPRRVWLQNLSCKPAIVENGASWSMVADFLRHLEQTNRCRHGTPIIAKAEFRGRDGISGGSAAIRYNHKFLIPDAYDHIRLYQGGTSCALPRKVVHRHHEQQRDGKQ